MATSGADCTVRIGGVSIDRMALATTHAFAETFS
jgi:hypothetical protein